MEDRTERRRVIEPAERALKVFISGRIREHLAWVRGEAERSLRALPFVRSWLFERTPPSSEELDESYLRHVREADFLVWLVDDDVTPPVRQEIATALDEDVPILAFLLPAPERTPGLETLLEQVRVHARTCTLPDEAALAQVLPMAIGDELVRALRGAGRPSRRRTLLAAGLDSRGRVIAKLQGAGLPRDRAAALADRPVVAPALDPYRPVSGRPLRVLVAEVGTGKSFLGERCLQEAIADAMEDPMAPVPLYERVASLPGRLTEWVEERAHGIGDPRAVGAFVVLDGADEAVAGSPARVLEDARALVNAFPATRVLLTSRPLPGLADADEAVTLPPLSDEDAMSLIAYASGEQFTMGAYRGLDAALRDALQRPLFALMYGVTRARDLGRRTRTRSDIVRTFVEHVLRGREDLHVGLDEVAARATMEARAEIHGVELGGFAQVQRLLNTGLLVQEGDRVRFPLALLQEWFAAQHLSRVGYGALLAAPRQRDRWRSALALAITQAPSARANEMLTWLFHEDPGFAAELTGELAPWGALAPERPPQGPAVDYGEEVQLATETVAGALGALGRELLPVDEAGRPHTLAVALDGAALLYARARRGIDPRVGELASGDPRAAGRWAEWGHIVLDARPGWAFAFVLRSLKGRLRNLLLTAALPAIGYAPYDREMAWLLALQLRRRGALDDRPISLTELTAVRPVLEGDAWFRYRRLMIPCRPLLDAIDAGLKKGDSELPAPWPGPDVDLRLRGSSWVWAPYTAGRMLERTRHVYAGAMQVYRGLVDAHFAALAPRLWHWRAFPARLVGALDPGAPDSWEGHPVLYSHFVPLPVGASDEVQIELSERGGAPSHEGLAEHFRRERPDACEWLSGIITTEALEVFGPAPATRLAYRWLCRDLSAIDLLEGAAFGPEL